MTEAGRSQRPTALAMSRLAVVQPKTRACGLPVFSLKCVARCGGDMEFFTHDACEYSQESLDPQIPLSSSECVGEEVTVRWLCPRCTGVTVKRKVKVFPGKGWLSGRNRDGWRPADVLPGRPDTVRCECGQRHPGRPATADALGCGAYWYDSTTT
jgi:hypothetical protein